MIFSREQDSDINASLDYGYTLILSMFAREIVLSGCMTQFGLKHSNQFNQFNLASDIMEPFRPIIDRIVYENRNSSFVKIKRELFTISQIPFTTMVKICTCPISSVTILRKSFKLSINLRKEFLSLGYELSIYAYDFNVRYAS